MSYDPKPILLSYTEKKYFFIDPKIGPKHTVTDKGVFLEFYTPSAVIHPLILLRHWHNITK